VFELAAVEDQEPVETLRILFVSAIAVTLLS
jgi:hypothetical protein